MVVMSEIIILTASISKALQQSRKTFTSPLFQTRSIPLDNHNDGHSTVRLGKISVRSVSVAQRGLYGLKSFTSRD